MADIARSNFVADVHYGKAGVYRKHFGFDGGHIMVTLSAIR
jgi:hypothetical protein